MEKRKSMWKRLGVFAGILFLFLILIRMAASYLVGIWLEENVNKITALKLRTEKVKVYPFLGKVVFHDFKVFDVKWKVETEVSLRVRQAEIDFEWIESVKNKFLVANIKFQSPTMYVITRRISRENIVEKTVTKLIRWGRVVNRYVKIDVPNLIMKNGKLLYEDYRTKPAFDVQMKGADLYLTDLGFDSGRPERKPLSSAKFKGVVEDVATLEAGGEIEFRMGENQKANYNIKLTDLPAVTFNELMVRYGDFEVNEGTLDIVASGKIENKGLKGHVKSTFTDLKVNRFENIRSPSTALERFWWTAENSRATVTHHPSGSSDMDIDFSYYIPEGDDAFWKVLGTWFKHSITRSFVPLMNTDRYKAPDMHGN